MREGGAEEAKLGEHKLQERKDEGKNNHFSIL